MPLLADAGNIDLWVSNNEELLLFYAMDDDVTGQLPRQMGV